MKIYTKFHDYYDTCIGWGIDPHCVYARTTVEHRCIENHFRMRNDVNTSISHDVLRKIPFFENQLKDAPRAPYKPNMKVSFLGVTLVFFCGKMYPAIKLEYPKKSKKKTPGWGTYSYKTTTEYFYDFEAVDAIMAKYASKTDKAEWRKEKRYIRSWEKYYFHSKSMKEYMERKGITHDEVMNYHYETGIPVFSLDEQVLTDNPCLQDLNFYRVFDFSATFQELSMFISGVLGGQSPKLVEISNADKIHKAGFNKNSFRNTK